MIPELQSYADQMDNSEQSVLLVPFTQVVAIALGVSLAIPMVMFFGFSREWQDLVLSLVIAFCVYQIILYYWNGLYRRTAQRFMQRIGKTN